jgi:hypothetical protein
MRLRSTSPRTRTSAQVESDEPQVTVNQRFEVFFREKRPFFLENAGYFGTPLNLFFSRRVRDPQAGVRMTGKVGGWAVGALTMDDRAQGQLLPREDASFGDRALNALARVRREFGQSNVGALVTTRDFGSSSNRVASIDTRLQLNPVWFFDGQAAVSDWTTLASTALNDTAGPASINRGARKLNYSLTYEEIGRDFRVPLGFVPRTDIRQVVSFASLRWRPKTGPVQARGAGAGELPRQLVVADVPSRLSVRAIVDYNADVHRAAVLRQVELSVPFLISFRSPFVRAGPP